MKGLSEVLSVLIILMMTLAFASLIYSYVGSLVTHSSRTIEAIDNYCISGNVTFVIRNGGSVDLNGNSLSCRAVDATCSTNCNVPDNIAPGKAGAVTIGGCTPGRAHTWNLQGPSNNINLYAECT